jgi:hypothetical protein
MSNQEIINIGTLPNDGEGDPLRVAFGKINNNFTTLFSTATSTSEAFTYSTDANQVIWEYPVSEFTQGEFRIRTGNPATAESQHITISAQISNDLASVKWTGYATTFFGGPLTTYDMNIVDGTIRILVTPFTTDIMQHFISASVTYADVSETAIPIELDGYSEPTVMTTENDLEITTE